MTSPNRPPLSKRMLLVAATAGTFVLGSAGVAFASTHDSTGIRVGTQPFVESSTSVGETTPVESPTAPALETKTFATRGGTVVVDIDHASHRVTLVSATPADGWTVKTHNPNPRGHGFVDVRFRLVTATDPDATSTTDDSGHQGNDDKAFTGTEIRVRVGFAAWRLVEFVSTRTFGPVEQPAAETTTTTEGSLEATSTTVDDEQGDDNGQDNNGKDHKSKDHKSKDDSNQGRASGSDDPSIHDQADDHGGRGQGGRGQGGNGNGGNGGNRGGGDDNGGGNRGGNGGGGDDQGGRHG